MKNLKYEFGDFSCQTHLRNLILPSQITIVLTNKCNLKCGFCSVSTKCLQTIDFEFAKKILFYCSENGIYNICFSGGEPIMHPQINELIIYAASLNLHITLVTNGLLLDMIHPESLSKLSNIGISLHGNEQIHDGICGKKGSYNIIIENLSKIKNIKVNINYTFSSLNSNYLCLEHVANIAMQYNMTMTVARINREGKALNGEYDVDPNIITEYVSKLLNEGYKIRVSNCIVPCSVSDNFKYLTHGCSAGVSSAGIEPNGDVKVCPTASFSLGNLHNNDLLDIWNNKLIKKMRSLKWLPITCKSCYNLLKCRGGCKIENYNPINWPNFGDILACKMFDDIWKDIENSQLILTTKYIRNENELFLILGSHLRMCNDGVIDILKKIDGYKTGNQLINIFDQYEQGQVKMLLVALYRDFVIKKYYGEKKI